MAYRQKLYQHWGYSGLDSPAQNGYPSFQISNSVKEQANTTKPTKSNVDLTFAEIHEAIQKVELEDYREATRLALRETLHCLVNFVYWMKKTPGVLLHDHKMAAGVASIKDKLDWRTGKNKTFSRAKFIECVEELESLGFIKNVQTIEAIPADYTDTVAKNIWDYSVLIAEIDFKQVVKNCSSEISLF